MFGTGSATQTAAVSDPAAFFEGDQWVPVVVGIVIALVVHGGKMLARPAANTLTAGAAAPVLSTGEDIGAVVLSLLALLIPVLVIVALVGLVLVWGIRHRDRSALARDAVVIGGGTLALAVVLAFRRAGRRRQSVEPVPSPH